MHRPATELTGELQEPGTTLPTNAPPDLVQLVAKFCEATTLGGLPEQPAIGSVRYLANFMNRGTHRKV